MGRGSAFYLGWAGGERLILDRGPTLLPQCSYSLKLILRASRETQNRVCFSIPLFPSPSLALLADFPLKAVRLIVVARWLLLLLHHPGGHWR